MTKKHAAENQRWPVMLGRYEIGNPESPVAVCTLATRYMKFSPSKVAIWGEMKTENLGIERLILNIISNPNIRFLIVCGEEVHGHWSGDALVNLYKNGVDTNSKKIIGTNAPMPFIENLPEQAVERFRQQVRIIKMIGEQNLERINEKIEECVQHNPGSFGEPMYVIQETKHKNIGANIPECAELGIVYEDVCLDPFSGEIVGGSVEDFL